MGEYPVQLQHPPSEPRPTREFLQLAAHTLGTYAANPAATLLAIGLTRTDMVAHLRGTDPLVLVHAARHLLEQAQDQLDNAAAGTGDEAATCDLALNIVDALALLPDPLADELGDEGAGA